ncbi:hypothetical protein KC19_2G085000 [Ceratodon purpureus]|uniref:Uncharacterized protein n=1 Tax=Ceratodon purpureus TaxID=3225 RepID=A0A8T0ITF3_CERPU|nr:hypothetical protein KC19_2G085000 [Ceratodon purpureus]
MASPHRGTLNLPLPLPLSSLSPLQFQLLPAPFLLTNLAASRLHICVTHPPLPPPLQMPNPKPRFLSSPSNSLTNSLLFPIPSLSSSFASSRKPSCFTSFLYIPFPPPPQTLKLYISLFTLPNPEFFLPLSSSLMPSLSQALPLHASMSPWPQC